MMTTGTTPPAGIDHPVARALVDAPGVLRPAADPAGIALWQVGDDQFLTMMLTMLELESGVAAIKLQMLGAMEERQVTQHLTALSTANWLNGTTASSLAAAHREVALANGLHRRFPAMLRAMVTGAVSAEQAAAIVVVLKKLPESLSVEQLQAAEAMMIGFAAEYGPTQGAAGSRSARARGHRPRGRRRHRVSPARRAGPGRSPGPIPPVA